MRLFKRLLPNNSISEVNSFSSSGYESIFDYIASHNVVTFVAGWNGTGDGHAWVCDGGQRITVTQRVALAGGGYQTIEISRKTYFRFNWGWCGKHDGFFIAGVFNPTKDSDNTYYDFESNPIYFHVEK